MKQFEEIKKEILGRAHKANACIAQYMRAYNSANITELCTIIKENFIWCAENEVIDADLIERFKSVFKRGNIYCNENTVDGVVLVSGDATVLASGDATVLVSGDDTVEASDNAIHRIMYTNEIRYCSDKIKFVKV